MLFQSGPFLTVGVPGADPFGYRFHDRCSVQRTAGFLFRASLLMRPIRRWAVV